jgi:hypothetical protein
MGTVSIFTGLTRICWFQSNDVCMFSIFDCEHCERANNVRGSSLVKERLVRTLFTSTANRKRRYCEQNKPFALCSHSVRILFAVYMVWRSS